ncbi:MAG: hypothetical protein F6K55_05390 [Moorea sp. SIO4A3]|nr:hypothetical protein [Moorena sp. SIO4A3]
MEKIKRLAEMVKKYPDYTLEEYCENWEDKTGVRVSASTMCRTLQNLGLSLKKKQLGVLKQQQRKNKKRD